jgi:ElaB/YqjD/DUF883 family membrane-anchored ribosome-binding protein
MSSVDTDIRRTDTRPQDIDPRATATREYVAEHRRMSWRAEAEKDPEDLERDIDETRADVRATLEALERRLSRDHLLDVTLGRVRSYGGEFAGNLGDAMKQNPVPLLLTSIGLAWMMMSNRRHDGPYAYSPEDRYGARERFGEAAGTAHERFGEAKERLGETASTAKERLGEAAAGTRERIDSVRGAAQERMHHAADAVRERWEGARRGFGSAGESARHGFEHTRERLHSAADSFRSGTTRAAQMSREQWYRARSEAEHLVHEQPLVLGALGFAAGALIGALLPPSETEDRMIGDARDRALRKAREAGEEGYRHVRDQAQTLAESAKERLREANGDGMRARGDEHEDVDDEDRAAGAATDATRGRERDYDESENYGRAAERGQQGAQSDSQSRQAGQSGGSQNRQAASQRTGEQSRAPDERNRNQRPH